MISGGGMNCLDLKIHGVTPWLAFRINGDILVIFLLGSFHSYLFVKFI